MKWVPLRKSQIQEMIRSPFRKISLHECVVFYKPGDVFQVSVISGRKLGKAHERNRIRRRIREAVRPLGIISEGQWIFMGRRPAIKVEFLLMQAHLQKALKEILQERADESPLA